MKIAVFADMHIPTIARSPQQAALDWALQEIVSENVDCALIAGDMTACGDADTALRVRNQLAACPVPCFTVPGNSDVRTPSAAQGVLQLFAPRRGGVRVGDARILGFDDEDDDLTPAEMARINRAPSDAPLILFSHVPHTHMKPAARAFMADFIRDRAARGQKTLFWFSGHLHVRGDGAFEGARAVAPRALDPDKCRGGLPEILILDTQTGEISSRAFTRGLFPEWTREEKREFADALGFSCYRGKEDLRFAIANAVPHLETRGVREVDSETRALIEAWRKAGGRTLSQHLSDLTWKGCVAGEDAFARTVECAIEMGADYATVHPPYETMSVMRADGEAFDALADRMAALLAPLTRSGVRVVIENNHTRRADGDAPLSLRYGCAPMDVVHWMDEMNARLGKNACAMRFDIGHARNNLPLSQAFPIGYWFQAVGALCETYHLHQTHTDPDGTMRNHYAITGLDDGFMAFHGFLWAWHEGILRHGPVILEIREELAGPDTWLTLRKLFLEGGARA